MTWNPETDHRVLCTPHIEIYTEPLWASEAEDPALEGRRRAVRDALSQLTPKQRVAVELFFFEGLSQGAIARRLGVSQQVISRRLYGARRGGRAIGGALAKLRAALGELLPAGAL